MWVITISYIISVKPESDFGEYNFLVDDFSPIDLQKSTGRELKELISKFYLGDNELKNLIGALNNAKNCANKCIEKAKGTAFESQLTEIYGEFVKSVDTKIDAVKKHTKNLGALVDEEMYSVEVLNLNLQAEAKA